MENKLDDGKGKMWGRDKGWELYGPIIDEEDSGPCCEHAVEIGPDKHRIPYAIVARDNDGGYHATSVCLICILNMAKKHGIEAD